MKKIICLLCCILNILIITSCNSAIEMGSPVNDVNVLQETPNTESKNKENKEKEESEETREDVPEINIVDKRLSGRLWSASHDYFYSDEDYLYYLPAYPMHEYIIVEYSDGTSQNIAEALAAGNVTIDDLDVFNIEYGKQLKSEVEERINNEEKYAS